MCNFISFKISFFLQMLKHVQISPLRNRSDSLSIRSTTSCTSSLCGSPEPPSEQLRATSRASSYCSLNDTVPQVIILFFQLYVQLIFWPSRAYATPECKKLFPFYFAFKIFHFRFIHKTLYGATGGTFVRKGRPGELLKQHMCVSYSECVL